MEYFEKKIYSASPLPDPLKQKQYLYGIFEQNHII